VAKVREGLPYLLECRTYRFRPHSMFDAELYRSKDEVAEWKKRDPIPLFFGKMKAAGVLGDVDYDAIEAEVAREIEAAVKFAEAGTLEPVHDLTRFVYSEVDSS
jgi:pyruvate dehydrogenase E1 component alpha subunit/2-oxoisovalerate dehydrogenase E1 component